MKKRLSEIKGFENCDKYIIHSDGRIFSRHSNKFLKPLKDSKGYSYIDIRSKKAKYSCPKVHRLVMLAFGQEKEEKEHINHIDGNKDNNDISNLEYVTNKENRKHAILNGLKDEYNYYIAQYDTKGNLLDVFDTGSEAIEKLGLKSGASGNIGRCIRGKRKTAYGFVWKQYERSTTISKESTV